MCLLSKMLNSPTTQMKVLLQISTYLLLLLMLACNSRPTPPFGVLSERKMQDLLYDMHLSEAMVDNFSSQEIPYSERQRFYDQVFEKHGVSRAKYDSSLVWYGAHLDIYTDIYTQVIARYDSVLNLVKRGDYTLLHTVEDRINTPLRMDSLHLSYSFTYDPARRIQGIVYQFRVDGDTVANALATLRFTTLIPKSRHDIKLRASLSVRYHNDTIRTTALVADSSSNYSLSPAVVDRSWRVKEYYGSIAMLEPIEKHQIPFFIVRGARFTTASTIGDSIGGISPDSTQVGQLSGDKLREDVIKLRQQKQLPMKIESASAVSQ